MKKYKVTLPLPGGLNVEVEAENEQEAFIKACSDVYLNCDYDRNNCVNELIKIKSSNISLSYPKTLKLFAESVKKIFLGYSSVVNEILDDVKVKEKKITNFRNIIREVREDENITVEFKIKVLWAGLTDYLQLLKKEIIKRKGKVTISVDNDEHSSNIVEVICGSVKFCDFDKNQNHETLESCQEEMKDDLYDKIQDETAHAIKGSDCETGYFRFKNKYYKIVIEFGWGRYDKRFYYLDGDSDVLSCEEFTPSPSQIGVVGLLWEMFSGTINEKGYKVLSDRIGVSLSENVATEISKEICFILEKKGFSKSNIIFVVDDYVFQYKSRDVKKISFQEMVK